MNCSLPPTFTEESALIWMDCRVGGVTVSETGVLVTGVELAVMFVVPTATAVTTPPLEMVAVAALEDDQVTPVVRSWLLLSLYVPVALN